MKTLIVLLNLITTLAAAEVPQNYELKYTGMSPVNVKVESHCGSLCSSNVYYQDEYLYRDLFSKYEVSVSKSNKVLENALLKGEVIDIYEEEVHRTILPNYIQIQLISRIPTENEVDMELDMLKDQKEELESKIETLKQKLDALLQVVDISYTRRLRTTLHEVRASDQFRVKQGPKQIVNKLTKRRAAVMKLQDEAYELNYLIKSAEYKIKKGYK